VGDVKKQQGQEDRWRLRVGDWRVIFPRDDSGQEIIVLAVASRGAAYR
jgi:mRNA interferase RelE/StbE